MPRRGALNGQELLRTPSHSMTQNQDSTGRLRKARMPRRGAQDSLRSFKNSHSSSPLWNFLSSFISHFSSRTTSLSLSLRNYDYYAGLLLTKQFQKRSPRLFLSLVFFMNIFFFIMILFCSCHGASKNHLISFCSYTTWTLTKPLYYHKPCLVLCGTQHFNIPPLSLMNS